MLDVTAIIQVIAENEERQRISNGFGDCGWFLDVL